MWTSYATLWALATSAVCVYWGLDLFRPLLFTSPAWVTLCVGPVLVPSVRKVIAFMGALFLCFWSVMQTYPVQCRNAWGAAMVADSSYWGNNEAISHALLRQKDEYFPFLKVDTSTWKGRLFTPTSQFRVHSDLATNMDNAQNLLEKLKNRDQNGGATMGDKWIMPWTRGDTLENFILRAYCDMHRQDDKLPHVYPLRFVGINPHEVKLAAACPFWACVLTEARPGGKLAFLWMIAVPLLLHWMHYRIGVYRSTWCWALTEPCTYFLGTGQCRLWWIWFWATLLPFWLVMLIKSTRDTELIPFFVEEITVLFEIRKWFLGEDTANDNEHLAFLVVFLVSAILLYIFRDRVRKDLGLDEIIPMLLSPGQTGGSPTFQVCIWRVDINASGVTRFSDLDTDGGPVISRPDGDDDSPDNAGVLTRFSRFSPARIFTPNLHAVWSYMPALSRARPDGYGLHGQNGGTPEAISVRLCYGPDEVQRTRVQKPSYGYQRACYDFYENFTLGVQPRPNVEFRVEVRDEVSGGDTLGSIVFSESRLKRQFQRANDVPRTMAGMSAADEQVMKMRQVRSQHRKGEEFMMTKMAEAGFVVHKLPDGGAVWLAFCDIEGEDAHVFNCC